MPGHAHSAAVSTALDDVVTLLQSRKFSVITGAGMSTDSGIPDYRGSGTVIKSRIDFRSFVNEEAVRQRYWLRAYFGWDRFAQAAPNRGHLALAALETSGHLSGVVTQNVDGLHRDAGTSRLVELHGSLARLVCLDCGQRFDRSSFHSQFELANQWLLTMDAHTATTLGPDGDTDYITDHAVRIPSCSVCTGILKPDVVFFGEFVGPKVFNAAVDIIKRSEGLMIAGSSLVVNSAVRLVESARRRRVPIVIINRGETKADRLATVRIEGGCAESLTYLNDKLGVRDILEDIE